MISTGMKVPVAVETYRAVINVPVTIEAVETGECWMKVPVSIESNGTMMKVPMTGEGVEPNEPCMKVPMAMQATVNVLMTVQAM